MNKENMIEWGKREIELAMEIEENDAILNSCYNAAFTLYCGFLNKLDDIALSDNIDNVKTIFIDLLNKNVLTIIEDNEADWSIIKWSDDTLDFIDTGYAIYQCKRCITLFKKITYNIKTGKVTTIKYTDTSRAICIDIDTGYSGYNNDFVIGILDEIMPISMPYLPDKNKIKVFTEEFKYHKDTNSGFDTIGVLCFKLSNGEIKKVMRFFKKDQKANKMVEINKTEYFARRLKGKPNSKCTDEFEVGKKVVDYINKEDK